MLHTSIAYIAISSLCLSAHIQSKVTSKSTKSPVSSSQTKSTVRSQKANKSLGNSGRIVYLKPMIVESDKSVADIVAEAKEILGVRSKRDAKAIISNSTLSSSVFGNQEFILGGKEIDADRFVVSYVMTLNDKRLASEVMETWNDEKELIATKLFSFINSHSDDGFGKRQPMIRRVTGGTKGQYMSAARSLGTINNLGGTANQYNIDNSTTNIYYNVKP